MRGKVPAGLCQIIGFGITPAYAGKSCTELTVKGEVKDHPRVCGEKPSGVMAALACAGITPAYAGKSTNSELSSPCTRDHPRVCGEKHTKGQTRPRVAGSPPRMRGKVDNVRCWKTHSGITPAYAGKSCHPHLKKALPGDHPRVCGEKVARPGQVGRQPGSPPRMRGKEFVLRSRTNKTRITPAYAGKSDAL